MAQKPPLFVDVAFVNNTKAMTVADVINFGVQQLVKTRNATKELAVAIMQSMQAHGPYFVLAPRLALAHAAPGAYCLHPALACAVFSAPVAFSADARHDVQVLITLSAPDANSHMQLLTAFAKQFAAPTLVDKLCACQNLNEVQQVLASFSCKE